MNNITDEDRQLILSLPYIGPKDWYTIPLERLWDGIMDEADGTGHAIPILKAIEHIRQGGTLALAGGIFDGKSYAAIRQTSMADITDFNMLGYIYVEDGRPAVEFSGIKVLLGENRIRVYPDDGSQDARDRITAAMGKGVRGDSHTPPKPRNKRKR